MAPAGSADARLLILGSLPGEASLAAGQYYAHPTNQFWALLGSAIREDLVALDYPRRLERLAARQIALWDVIASARRQGSLDGAIRGVTPNQLARFVVVHPSLEAVAFNGRTAATIGRRAFAGVEAMLLDLPSSSAALTRPFAEKADAWACLARYAGVAPETEKSTLWP